MLLCHVQNCIRKLAVYHATVHTACSVTMVEHTMFIQLHVKCTYEPVLAKYVTIIILVLTTCTFLFQLVVWFAGAELQFE